MDSRTDVAVRITDLAKRYGPVTAMNDVSFEVGRGEFFSLVGPSGCGKTTTLRSIIGLIPVDSGTIEIFGRDVTDLPIHRRDIGMVFQNYALFPHMTVAQNVGFGLRMRGVARQAAAERVERALDLVQLDGKGPRFPHQLSGGQQQRVALARALVIEPQVLLLDEPLSNLDARLRKDMQFELRALQKRLGLTAIYVTHDQEEALSLSDRIAVMSDGAIAQLAVPMDVYRRPVSPSVARTVGRVNFLAGTIRAAGGGSVFVTAGGDRFSLQGVPAPAGEAAVDLMLRPENVQILSSPASVGDGLVAEGRIVQAIYAGAVTDYLIEIAGGIRLLAEEQNAQGEPRHGEGQIVRVHVDPAAIYPIPSSGEARAAEPRHASA